MFDIRILMVFIHNSDRVLLIIKGNIDEKRVYSDSLFKKPWPVVVKHFKTESDWLKRI